MECAPPQNPVMQQTGQFTLIGMSNMYLFLVMRYFIEIYRGRTVSEQWEGTNEHVKFTIHLHTYTRYDDGKCSIEKKKN